MENSSTANLVHKLRLVLRLNAGSCLIFGSAFSFWSGPISGLIGNEYPRALGVVGLGLIFNGAHLILASRRELLRWYEITYFAFGDALWVLATLALICMGLGLTSAAGIALALLIGAMVGSFGWLQASFGRSACAAGLLSRKLLA